MRWFIIFAIAAFCFAASCTPSAKSGEDKEDGLSARNEEPAEAAPSPEDIRVTTLAGSAGQVKVGDDLATAKNAFPAPSEAEVFDTSMSFAILGVDGWAWAAGVGTGFEAALIDGKIIAMTLTELDGPPPTDAVDTQTEAIGQPTGQAESENAAVLVWESGDNARFYVLLKSADSIFGPGAMTIIGPKEKLKLLNYHYDDPDTLLTQLDQAASIAQSMDSQ